MRKGMHVVLPVYVCLMTLMSFGLEVNTVSQAATAQEIQTESKQVLNDFKAKVPNAKQVLKTAKGVLIFPSVYSGALGVGGQYGQGELLVNKVVHGYYRIAGVSAGLQAGGKSQSLIFAFMSQAALNKFIQSKGWDVAGDASAVVMNKGTLKETELQKMSNNVLVYGLNQKGLMASLSLQGIKISKIQK